MSLDHLPWLKGLILPEMTPFTEDDEVDPEGLRSQVEFYRRAGDRSIDGIYFFTCYDDRGTENFNRAISIDFQ